VERLTAKKYRRVLTVGIILSASQQLSGFYVVVYYSAIIFSSVGFSHRSSLLLSAASVVPQAVVVILSLKLVDRWGRRTMLFISLAGLALGCLILGLAFFDPHHPMSPNYDPEDLLDGYEKWLAVLGMLIYRASFSMGMGPVPLMLAAEICPSFVRGKAMAIAGMANWLAIFSVTQTFPIITAQAGPAITYLIYIIVILCTTAFVKVFVPETSGKSLEELEKLLIQL